MKIKYKIIDLRTIKGFEEAERLQAQGWEVYSVGLYTIHLYK